MYPELKIKNCKKKSSTYFIFIHLHIIQYIIYTLLLPYFRFSNLSLKSGRLPTSFISSSLEDNHLLLGRMPRKIEEIPVI
jgi:hypothetical protein